MNKQKYLAMTALFAVFFAFTVIGLGAFTRLIDAGLGCPDWPGCYGHFIAPLNIPNPSFDVYKAWAEMIHRYFAGTLGIFILIIVGLIFTKKLRHRSNIILACCLLSLLFYQILLGQWTVTYKLMPIVVTQHLVGGFLLLILLWLVYLNNRKITIIKSSKAICWGTLLGLFILFTQILLGAWTSTNYASLSCPDFPFCLNSQPFLAMHFKEAFTIFSPLGVNYEGGVLSQEARQTIQMLHRFVALLFTMYFILLTVIFSRKIKSFEITKFIFLLWGLLLTQICIGIVNVLYKLPIITAISHNLVAVVLLLTMVTLVYKLFIRTRYPLK